jgi:hypothetical protein
MDRLSNVCTFGGVVEMLQRGARAIAAAVLLFLLPTAVHAAGPMRPFPFGLWSAGAYTNDQTGAISHCAAYVPNNSGVVTLVTVSRSFDWSLRYVDPRWTLTPKTQIPIELHFDGGPAFSGVGTVLTPTMVEVPMPDNFRNSLQMSAQTQGQSFSSNLNFMSRLMFLLANCVRTE